jgi:hypothetical protein
VPGLVLPRRPVGGQKGRHTESEPSIGHGPDAMTASAQCATIVLHIRLCRRKSR